MNPEIEQDTSPDEGPPSWEDMRCAGLMVVDSRFDKLAVYVGAAGHLVIMSEVIGDDAPHFHTVQVSNVSALVDALHKSLPHAQEAHRAFEQECEHGQREYEAWHASIAVIERMRQGASS